MSAMFQKNSVALRISREMALDYGLVEPTPEERERREAESRRFRAEQIDQRAKFRDAITKLEALGGLTADILHLHAPDLDARYHAECPGCDFSGGEGEPPEWPCRTVRLLAEHFGIDMPDWHMPAADYDEERP